MENKELIAPANISELMRLAKQTEAQYNAVVEQNKTLQAELIALKFALRNIYTFSNALHTHFNTYHKHLLQDRVIEIVVSKSERKILNLDETLKQIVTDSCILGENKRPPYLEKHTSEFFNNAVLDQIDQLIKDPTSKSLQDVKFAIMRRNYINDRNELMRRAYGMDGES